MLVDYKCKACENVWEVLKKYSDPDPENCPKCASKIIFRMVSKSNFRLRGDGWYKPNKD